MKNEQTISITKFIIYTIMSLQRPITAFFLFFVGIAVGLTLRSHLKDFSFSYSLDPQLSLPLTSLWSPAQQINIYPDPRNMMGHGQEDEELINRVLEMDPQQIRGRSKVAFLFLTKGPLPLAPLWEMFFDKHKGNFSVYIHMSPRFNWTIPKHSVFYGSIIPSKEVEWGKFNMIEAERRLLANALLEPTNQRFVLLSESCIPLFNFPTIYSYLMDSAQNFVEAFNQPGPSGIGRYKKAFKPLVFPAQWLKGSQWFTVTRDLAMAIVSDNKYFPRFKKICGSATCHADEHYLPTFANLEFADKNSNRSLTWVDWSGGGMHPRSFFRMQVTVEFLKGLRNIRGCENKEEKKTDCFLFARKFLPNSLIRLTKIAPMIMRF